jgi:hypothetical protein
MKDDGLAFLFVSAVLFVLGILPPTFSTWTFLVVILVSWVVADTVVNFILRGGNGIFQIRFLGHQTQFHGYAYLAFTIMVVVATVVGTLLSQDLAGLASNSPIVLLIERGLTGGLVWLDLHARFFWKKVLPKKK